MSDSGFWSSIEGIANRIADIGHNFSWATLTESIKGIFLGEPSAKVLVWINDYDPCPICADSIGNTYTKDDPMLPTFPDDTHPLCRCYLKLEKEIDVA